MTVNPNSIYFYWVIYTVANDTKFCADLNLTTPNTNTDSASFGCIGTVPIWGPGGGEAKGLANITEERGTFCGDGICQALNDYGFQEDFYSCQMDCQPFDFDALVFSFTKNCWDGDPSTICVWGFGNIKIEGETIFENGEVCINGVCQRLSGKTIITNCFKDDKDSPCFWDTDESKFFLFILLLIIVILSFVRVKAPGKKKKVSPYKYVFLRSKELRKLRRIKKLKKKVKGIQWRREK